ncbi:helix-turn-helix transcriptional regulator [Acidisoma sp. S159]|uniref:helix-turn-helix transcriptional regulator n=1 Tax=Acidisoma sp. S159 TaxID=1747225 RepID=UPI00352B99E8
MRQEPAQRLLNLAMSLAGTRVGLTLDEMASSLGVARRTAERLRDALAEIFPQLDFNDDEQRVRRWRLPGGALAGVAEPRAEAVAAVEAVAREYGSRGELDRAGLLRDAATTLRALMRPDALRRVEPDIAALMEGEGIAMRPGHRPRLDPSVLPALRRAILGVQLIAVRYARDADEAPVTRILCPYGTLYGGDGRAWLVGHVEELPEMRLWRLDRVLSVDLLDRSYAKRQDFDLATYARQSFGVFQEQPIDVILKIEPEGTPDALSWLFHPSQTIEPVSDGGLIVRFRAGGVLEMCWHLFTWGQLITVLEPQQLRSELSQMATNVAHHHAKVQESGSDGPHLIAHGLRV